MPTYEASHEVADELRRTLQQIGPATFAEVLADVRGRLRLGLLMFSRDTDDLPGSLETIWTMLLAAGAIEHVGGLRYRARPLAAIATGDSQLRLFV